MTAPSFLDLARMTTATTGTGTITLGSAVSGFLSFAAAGAANGGTYAYGISDGANAEVGTGVYSSSGTTLTRNVTASTNGGSAINLSGAAQVFICPRAEDMVSIAGSTGALSLGNGLDLSGSTIELTAARRTLPTTQAFTSGMAATYTTPANCLWIEVWIVGGGGGGGGSGTSPGAGGTGGTSTFNSVNAVGGSGGAVGSTVGSGETGGAGGSGGTGTATRRASGGAGGSAAPSLASQLNSAGGEGGAAAGFGGGGKGGISAAGSAPPAGFGGGGGGGGGGTTQGAGGGGGGGEVAYLLINSPSATYTYTVGAAGSAGAGSLGGGAGFAGYIFVLEHYGS